MDRYSLAFRQVEFSSTRIIVQFADRVTMSGYHEALALLATFERTKQTAFCEVSINLHGGGNKGNFLTD